MSATAAPMKPKNGADGGHRGLTSATMATSDQLPKGREA